MDSLKIQFRDIRPSSAISAALEDSVRELESYNPNITSCNVVVSKPHRKHTKGGIYHVDVRFRVSGEQIIINREPEKNHAHEDVYVAIRDAFSAARRRLKEHLQKHGYRAGRKKTGKVASKRSAKEIIELANVEEEVFEVPAKKLKSSLKSPSKKKRSSAQEMSWLSPEERKITWIATCNRAGARIFKKQQHDIELFHSLDFPLGRERTRALRTDKPSVTRSRFAGSGAAGTHRMTGGKDPHEELAVSFSKTIAAYLKNGLTNKQFEDLVIVAEPHFLGLIKIALDKKTKGAVSNWIAKDLVKFSIPNIKKLFLTEKEVKGLRFRANAG